MRIRASYNAVMGAVGWQSCIISTSSCSFHTEETYNYSSMLKYVLDPAMCQNCAPCSASAHDDCCNPIISLSPILRGGLCNRDTQIDRQNGTLADRDSVLDSWQINFNWDKLTRRSSESSKVTVEAVAPELVTENFHGTASGVNYNGIILLMRGALSQ